MMSRRRRRSTWTRAAHDFDVLMCIEAALRFQLNISELEKKVTSALKVFSERQGRECTLLGLMNYTVKGNTCSDKRDAAAFRRACCHPTPYSH
ncbi:hypothetical protein MTO96_043835 [Rhipicephalus appendiculatus]